MGTAKAVAYNLQGRLRWRQGIAIASASLFYYCRRRREHDNREASGPRASRTSSFFLGLCNSHS